MAWLDMLRVEYALCYMGEGELGEDNLGGRTSEKKNYLGENVFHCAHTHVLSIDQLRDKNRLIESKLDIFGVSIIQIVLIGIGCKANPLSTSFGKSTITVKRQRAPTECA